MIVLVHVGIAYGYLRSGVCSLRTKLSELEEMSEVAQACILAVWEAETG